MKKIFSFCKHYLAMYKWCLFFYVFLSLLGSGASLVSPYIMGDFIDQLINADGLGFIYRYFALFASISLATLLLGYISSRLYVKLQTQMGYALNRDFIKRLQHAPLNFTRQQDTAYLNQRINNDSNAVIIFCIGVIQSVLANAIIIVATLVLLFAFHPALAGALLGIATAYFTFYALYKRVLYKASHAYQESQSKFFAKLNEQLFNVRFIKLHSLFGHFIGRLNNSFDSLLKNALNHQRTGYIFSGLDTLVTIVAQMVLLLLGGREIIAGRLTVGRFIIISSYFNMMLGAIRYFFSLGQTIQSNMVSYNRLQELATVAHEPNGTDLIEEVCDIELRGLSFAYDENGEKPLLKDININFARGNIYVVLGPNGAGKSTLADIIMGLQVGNYIGQVLYNGVSIDSLDMYTLRNNQIAVSEQEPILLADTLAYNLNLDRYGHIHVRQSRVEKLLKILGLEAYISTLPNGFETIINENAANISGGEKQKISILRALIKDSDVLVLDEPTSALDTTSKISLRGYLNELKKDKIIFIITHDKEFIGSEDVIVTI